MKKIIANLVNGNLTDAKKGAVRFSHWKIMTESENLGYQTIEAYAIASYLKDKMTFQKFCDFMDGRMLA